MSPVTRVTDLGNYTSVLPYASEMLDVYQPLIGWKSRRKLAWVTQDAQGALKDLLSILGRNFQNRAKVDFNVDCAISAPGLAPADLAGPRLVDQNWIVLRELAKSLTAPSAATLLVG